MSFSERRYESQGAGAPIFGIQPTLRVKPIASVPIITNIGALCSPWVNNQHIAFQKTTCPSGNLSVGIYSIRSGQYCKLLLGHNTSFRFRNGSFSDELCSPLILAFDVQPSTPKAEILVRPCSSKKPLISETETILFFFTPAFFNLGQSFYAQDVILKFKI